MLFEDVDAPAGIRTGEFVLRPIRAADTPLDYEAVMESRELLRPWEQTGWPADDFTLEEDLADVEGLERRHGERHAFTYTVLSPDESECLGCVYLMPPDAKHYREATIAAAGDERWDGVGALVSFWVGTSRLADGLDERLLAALQGWLRDEWSLGHVLFVTNEQVPQQVELLERAGLRPRFTVRRPGESGAFVAYA